MANDNIFQQYLTPPKSVMEYSAEMDQADARRQSLQQNALTMAATQQKFQDDQRDRDAENHLSRLLRAGGTPDQVAAGLAQAGYGKQALAYTKQQQDLAKAKADADHLAAQTGKTKAETDKIAYDQREAKRQKAITDIAAFTDAQQAATSLKLHIAAGDIDPAQGQMIMQTIPQNPGDFAKWQIGMLQRIMAAKDSAGQIAPDANTVANNDRIRAEGQANRENAIKVQRMIGDRQEAGDAANSTFTPEAIGNAADRYNVDGTLPPMGMGKAGSAGRAAILNEAARRKAAEGVSGTDQRIAQLGAKGEAQAKAASLRAYSAAGKEGQAIQAANTGLNHLETVEQLALAQKNGQTQLFNSLANKLAAATGQPAPTNLAAAITMVSPEVSKAVIGAAGGQAEREEFAKNFNPNGSPEQALQGIGVIKELMGGRMTEAQRTYERTTGKKDFRQTMLSPAAQRVLDKAHGAASAGGKPSLSDIFGH